MYLLTQTSPHLISMLDLLDGLWSTFRKLCFAVFTKVTSWIALSATVCTGLL